MRWGGGEWVVGSGGGGEGGETDSLGETVSSWILTPCQPHSNRRGYTKTANIYFRSSTTHTLSFF